MRVKIKGDYEIYCLKKKTEAAVKANLKAVERDLILRQQVLTARRRTKESGQLIDRRWFKCASDLTMTCMPAESSSHKPIRLQNANLCLSME